MAKKYDLDPEEAKTWRLAKLFDLRSFIGALFVIFGVLVLVSGFMATEAEIQKAAGINLGLWVGAIMLATGILFLVWVLLNPPPPITKEQMAAHRRELEEMGTTSAIHH